MTLQKFGRYEIKDELGRGGMATVYRAYDPRFEREVALKVLPREMLHDPQFRIRFEREAKTVAALEHPAIVPVYDVGEEDGQPYFVMRFMTGGSLQDRIARGPLSLAETAKIFERLAPAMDDSHAKGIIHRDLKPGNILFDRTGEPYISDFGIAKITQAQGGTVTGGAIIGTPAYMSPEQAQGETVDGRSDIYALGVILFEMLSGSQPFQATTPMAVVVKHITDPIPHILDKNPKLPFDIEPIIEKAMAKNRDQRFATAAEFAAALTFVAQGQPAEQAIQTASMNATRIAAAKTHAVAGKTQVAQQHTPAKTVQTGGGGFGWLIAVPIVLVLIVAAGVGGYFVLTSMMATPAPTATTAPVVVVEPTATPAPPTDTPAPVESTATTAPAEPTATETETPPAGRPVIGGADQIAFVANSEIWVVNMDGSELTQLTTNGQPKTDLQWIPGTRTISFISGTNVNTVDADTQQFDTIMSFPFAKFLEVFRVSPDGKQVALSLNREMYIVPFDLAQLKTARGKDALIAMKGCLTSTGKTLAAAHTRDFRWSLDGKTASWLAQSGSGADAISIVDISTCDEQRFELLDVFPDTRFTPEGSSEISDFDWDGDKFFIMNNAHRNNGWGFLYSYNHETRQGMQENPIAETKSRCCYRDARWSPDQNYIFFAFQSKDDLNKTAQFYYIPVNALRTGTGFVQIELPEGFFKNPKESPQLALHPVSP